MVKIRIFDRDDRYLEDLELPPSEAVYISPGKYLSDYLWAKDMSLKNLWSRMILSVGTAHEGLRDLSSERDYPWMSVWVDSL